ncbi:hypothetical protein K4A83_21385, partial [Spirulina subsalsa FACHB-351]
MKHPILKTLIALTLTTGLTHIASPPTQAQNITSANTTPTAELPDLARQAVIRQATLDTNIPLTDLEILSAFATTWGNGCMGISRPGQ